MMLLKRLVLDDRAAMAAEFAFVLPLMLILIFAVIDGGRFIWEYNRAEKATQMGARMAAVIDPVAGGISTTDFTGVGGLVAGDPIPASTMPDITCDEAMCACTSCPAGLPGTYNATAFNDVVDRMKDYFPAIAAANVEVVYRGSGLGYAGDPTGPDISPIVTVRLKSLQFTPITSFMLTTISMPAFSTSLTAEDMVGNKSN
jgi:hypothetical protein